MSPISIAQPSAAQVSVAPISPDRARAYTDAFRSRLVETIGVYRFDLWFEHGTSITLSSQSAEI